MARFMSVARNYADIKMVEKTTSSSSCEQQIYYNDTT